MQQVNCVLHKVVFSYLFLGVQKLRRFALLDGLDAVVRCPVTRGVIVSNQIFSKGQFHTFSSFFLFLSLPNPFSFSFFLFLSQFIRALGSMLWLVE